VIYNSLWVGRVRVDAIRAGKEEVAVDAPYTVCRLQRATSSNGHVDRQQAALDCGWTRQYLEHDLARTAG